MMFLPAPSASGYFMLPAEAADKGLKLAGAAQLKVLIAVYRNMASPADLPAIAALTGLSEGDAEDALNYWIGRGLVVRAGEEIRSSPAADKKTAPAEKTGDTTGKPAEDPGPQTAGEEVSAAQEKKHINKAVRPTLQQINQRCGEDPEIREFFRQAQLVLGRTVGYDSQSQMLLCIDYLGLPPSVVLMICQYAKQSGKSGFSYIWSIAEDWAHDGIDTVEAANERIAALETAASLWKTFAVRIGNANPAPSKKQSEYLFRWSTELGYGLDEILLAYDEMADHTSSFSFAYMDKVLTGWRSEGLKTADQIRQMQEAAAKQKADQKAQQKTPSAQKKEKKDAPTGRAAVSYDIAAAENAASQGAPVYERKKKKK